MLRVLGFVFTVLFLAFVYYGFVEMVPVPEIETPQLYEEVITVGEGYGYQIYHGNRLFIQQEFIPALHGNKHFASPEDAKRVAKLVMSKLKKGTSPEITLEELKAMDVVILEE